MSERETIRTRIWREEPEPDNPFAAAACYCHGYDVYADVLGQAGWIEFLYLLFRGDRPDERQVRLLENLAVAIANPGPRDHSVQAAMNGGVGGSQAASCLMAALAVGAGQLGGAHEVALAMEIWRDCGRNLDRWEQRIGIPATEDRADVWPSMQHAPGFDPHGASCASPVKRTLRLLAESGEDGVLAWLRDNRTALERFANHPLAMTGVAAAALHDLGFEAPEGEMLYLILRLPGAAAHALEQRKVGFRNFPFYRHAVRLGDGSGTEGSDGGPAR